MTFLLLRNIFFCAKVIEKFYQENELNFDRSFDYIAFIMLVWQITLVDLCILAPRE